MRRRPAVTLSLAAALAAGLAAAVLSSAGGPLAAPDFTPGLPVVAAPPPPTPPALPNARVIDAKGRTAVFFSDELAPSDAEWLASRPRLGPVSVRHGGQHPPTDATLRLLRGAPVGHLTLSGWFTDAGLLHLAGHPHLRSLSLDACPKLTGAGVAALLERLPGLESLSLTGFALSARDAAVVFRLPLRSLRLTGCTGEGADRLARWRRGRPAP